MQNEHPISGLKINAKTGLYEIKENSVTYIFDFDMMINLQCYLAEVDSKQNTDPINSWYKNLPLRKRLTIYVLLQDLRVNHQRAIL
jgi:hypothetical protein